MGNCKSGGGCGNSRTYDCDFLGHVPLFKKLTKDDFAQLLEITKEVIFNPGQVLINQGDEGTELFVIKKGKAVVVVDGRRVATLVSGDFFGESALLKVERRTATVRIEEAVTALVITASSFKEMGLHSKVVFAKRVALPGGKERVFETKPATPKDAAEKKRMKGALMENQNLAGIADLDDARCNMLIERAWLEKVPENTDLIVQGSLNADYFYIVKSGKFHMFEKGHVTPIGSCEVGGSFGELALLYFAPRACTVRAQVASEVWVIDRHTFKETFSNVFANKIDAYVKLFEKIDVLHDAPPAVAKRVATALIEMSFKAGETIFEKGEPGDMLYILTDGVVDVMNDGVVLSTLKASPGAESVFGELALVNDEPRKATIVVKSPLASVLTLDRHSFEMMMDPEGFESKTKPGSSAPTEHMKLKDLQRNGLLGVGGFGTVELVTHIPMDKVFALKVLSKGYIVQSGTVSNVMHEKTIQLMCNSVFVVKLYETYNSKHCLYLLLELCSGGELYSTYNRKNLWKSLPCAKFYVGGASVALNYLHSLKVIFRDLKPENLLLDGKGKVKLTDMGLAKYGLGLTYTTCGTPTYFSPEIIKSKGHGKAVDWWTVGILLFELMAGNPPFDANNPSEMYGKVLKGIGHVPIPKHMKGHCEDLIKGLLVEEPSHRLCMQKGGFSRMKQHPWYSDFDWDAFTSLTMVPPYIPLSSGSKVDTSNFHAKREDAPPMIAYQDNGSGWDSTFATCNE